MVPQEHQSFIDRALPIFQEDSRYLGLAAAGSFVVGGMDQYSDLDLIAVVDPGHYASIVPERLKIVARLGHLLAAFTGEHVGESRVLICLFDHPLLHVDVKFVGLDDLRTRIENPVVLWERDDVVSKLISQSEPLHPMPDLQWIEDRFWIWVHYAALRLGRGELFEVLDCLNLFRTQVLGPLALVSHRQLPRGVRRLETLARPDLADFKQTVAAHDRRSCIDAISTSVALYRKLRDQAPTRGSLQVRAEAETAAMAYFTQVAT